MIKLVGRGGAVISLIFFLSILDTFVSGHLEPKGTYRALPGTTRLINGKLQRPVDSADEITYSSDTPAVKIVFLEAKGRLWRGRLEVNQRAKERDYSLIVYLKGQVPDEETPILTVRVFEDRARYQASFKSISQKHLGIPPWWISVVSLPLALVSFGAVYLLSSREEALLAREGIAEIYRIIRRDEAWEITFGLGRDHGIKPRDRLKLLNAEGRPVGDVVVTIVEAEQSHASVDRWLPITPNFFVSKS